MTLHLQKLCVGAKTPQALLAMRAEFGWTRGGVNVVTTRHYPKRADEILDGGSLYWVMSGAIRVRQTILEIERGPNGCVILIDAKLHETDPQPRRPFQGWRYLAASDAPADLRGAAGNGALPPALAAELKEIGAW